MFPIVPLPGQSRYRMSTFIWQRRGRFTVFAFSILIAALVVFFMQAASGGDPYTVVQVVDVNPDPNVVETTITARAAAVDIGNGVTASVLTFNGTIPGPQFRLKVGDTVIVHFVNNIAHPTGIHWHGIELNNASDGTPLTQNQVAPGDTFLYKFKVSRPGIYWYHPHHHSSTNQVFKGLYGSILVADPNEDALVAAGTLPPAGQTRTLVLSDLTVCKTPGANDAATYAPSMPHVSGSSLFPQAPPTPRDLCERAPLDEDGNSRGAFAAGDVPNIQRAGTTGRVNEGQTVITNGINVGARAGTPSAPGALAAGARALDVQAGQGLRLQMINATNTRYFRLRLTTSAGVLVPLVRIGGQGGLLDRAVIEGGITSSGFDTKYTAGEILLPPADRPDVVAAIPASATGVLTLWTEDFKRAGGGYLDIPTVPVAHFNVTGSAPAVYTIAAGTPLRAATGHPVEALGPATATLLNPALFAPAKPGLASQNIELTLVGLASLGINNVIGTHDSHGDYTTMHRPASARFAPGAPLGSTLELTVENLTFAHHPFHLHGFSIQPLDLTRPGEPSYTFPYTEFIDTIDIPANYTLRFRVRLDDRPLMDGTTPGGALGRWVFHCHIFFHAMFGMISEFNVVGPNGNERPYINADDTLVQGNSASVLTTRGSYVDREGDPVTLTASSGTITPDADGSRWTWARSGGASGLVYVTATDSGGRRDQVAFDVLVSPATGPTLTLNRPTARFAVVNNGGALSSQTSAQTFTVSQSGGAPVAWTAGANRSWITVTPAAGTGTGALTVAVNNVGNVLPASGQVTGTVTITAPEASNTPQTLVVTLDVFAPGSAAASPPFGSFDTPVGDATVLAGSVAVTGWTLDNIGIKQVEIWRDLQPGETTPPYAGPAGDPRNGKVFIANGVFTDGARPDVEGLYPTTPANYRAGWGYLMLTWGLFGQGNGTYKLYAFGVDLEGNTATIGTKSLIISNNTATKPFGSIDTPGIGGDASGPNFGWGLTPKVNGAATCKIQSNGVQVSIDSGPLQPVVYGDARPDIAGAFTGFSNTSAAGGHFIFDWSTLTNGPHTIGWLITDDCNRADGVGSRFFNVTNGVSALTTPDEFRLKAETSSDADFRLKAETTEFGSVASAFRRNEDDAAPLLVARGYGELPVILEQGTAGSRTVDVPQGDRIELRAPRGYHWAYQLGPDGQRRPLPTGATWDAAIGAFYWQPAPGFLGRYRIVLTDGTRRISVRINVVP